MTTFSRFTSATAPVSSAAKSATSAVLLFTTMMTVVIPARAAEEKLRDPALISSEFIYETAPFPSCHASTLAETKDGVVAAWFGGRHEKSPDVGIWFARQENGKWTAPVEVANGVQFAKTDGTLVRHPTWNPVLFQAKDGPLLLFYKAGPTPETWWGMLTRSNDGGRTWEEPRRLPEGILGPIKNKPVQLSNGDLLCPVSHETPEDNSKWTVTFERSPDLGRTWSSTGPVNDGAVIQAIQPSILFTGGGGGENLLAIGRTRQNHIFQTASSDGGRTWGAMTLGSLPNPNSGTDAVTLKDGRQLIIYNHVPGKPGEWGGKRTPLNLAISADDGKTWKAAMVLEDQPGEYSYPAIIQTADGKAHLSWTWKRQLIRHAVIDPDKLQPRDFVDGAWPK